MAPRIKFFRKQTSLLDCGCKGTFFFLTTKIFFQKISFIPEKAVPLHRFCERDVAQLVAHYVRDVGAAGSSPVIPTRDLTAVYSSEYAAFFVIYHFTELRIYSCGVANIALLSCEYRRKVLRTPIGFKQDYLRELYQDGKTQDKKHRFQPQVIKGYRKAVDAFITTELAFKLEAALGTKAYVWIEMQAQYNYCTTKTFKKSPVCFTSNSQGCRHVLRNEAKAYFTLGHKKRSTAVLQPC